MVLSFRVWNPVNLVNPVEIFCGVCVGIAEIHRPEAYGTLGSRLQRVFAVIRGIRLIRGWFCVFRFQVSAFSFSFQLSGYGTFVAIFVGFVCNRRLMNAEKLAVTFASRFLENGNYEAQGGKFTSETVTAIVSPGDSDALDDYFAADEGFAGLAVQSVGYTDGGETEAVVIYVTKGSKRALKSLPDSVEGVPVITEVMGRLKAGPSAAASAGQGFLFEHKGRIACGSSCAPSRENYAGTLGCLARSTNDGRLYALSNNHVFAACNHTPVGMPILAPATADARPRRRAPGAACVFESMVELRSGVPSLVNPMKLDAAMAHIENAKTRSC
jgi:hypothetical protein